MRFITKKKLIEKKDERSILDYSFYSNNLKESDVDSLSKATNLAINQIIEGDCLESPVEDYNELKGIIEEYLWINLENNLIEYSDEEFEKSKKIIFESLYLDKEKRKEIKLNNLRNFIERYFDLNKKNNLWLSSGNAELEIELTFNNNFNLRENTELNWNLNFEELMDILKLYIEYIEVDKFQHPNLSL